MYIVALFPFPYFKIKRQSGPYATKNHRDRQLKEIDERE